MITDSDSPLLICYDGSENAKYAIERAGALLGGRRAVVVTVWQPTADLGSMVWSDMPASMVDFVELDRAAAEGGGHMAEEGVRIAHEAGLEADAIAVKASGPVWNTILLGSVSNAVVHHAEQPTLVIRIPTNDAAHAHEPRS